jgi:hypothetical protein
MPLAILHYSYHVTRREASVPANTLSMEIVKLKVGASGIVSGLLQKPPRARACYVFTHGAGASMTHSFMAEVANSPFERGIATLRYQFPYIEKGSKRPDSPSIAHATVRAAVAEAVLQCSELPLFVGGKSIGGRMTSPAQALRPFQGCAVSVYQVSSSPVGKPSVDGPNTSTKSKSPCFSCNAPGTNSRNCLSWNGWRLRSGEALGWIEELV